MPNAFNASSWRRAGSRSPFLAASIIRYAMISRTVPADPKLRSDLQAWSKALPIARITGKTENRRLRKRQSRQRYSRLARNEHCARSRPVALPLWSRRFVRHAVPASDPRLPKGDKCAAARHLLRIYVVAARLFQNLLALGQSEPMSAPGHSRPSLSAQVPANVRYAPNSDRFLRRSKTTLSANRQHRGYLK